MKERSESEKQKIIKEAKKRFQAVETWEAKARINYVEDVKFGEGDSDNMWQWPDDVRQPRETDARPMLTINKTRQHVLDVLNDARQSKVGVKIIPTGGQATYESAQAYMGVVRSIEYRSNAEVAYQGALKCAVQGGIGYWRILTDYVDDDSFDKEILVRRVRDPMLIFLDPDINEFDGSDARFCFAATDVPKDVFEARYPKWKGRVRNSIFSPDTWVTEDKVRVAEYWRRLDVSDKLLGYLNPDTGLRSVGLASKLPRRIRKAVLDDPNTISRDVGSHAIECFTIIGDEIAEETDWEGIYMPFVRVIGEETVIDKQLDRKGHVRALKDAQRMFNYNCPLSLDTPLPTPTGWTTMGEVQGGDWLLDEAGKPVEVAGTSPTFLFRDCYRVRFDDGSEIVADSAHKWTVEERGKRISAGQNWSTRTITTEELEPKRHFIYAAKAMDLPEAALPIDPYVLGMWLGDGHSHSGRITSGAADVEATSANLSACGYHISEPKFYGDRTAADVTVFGLQPKLRAEGLLCNKHIPDAYLRASRAQRLALLQGLMDADGNVSQYRQCSFINTNEALAAGFAELLRSLGIKAVSRKIVGTAKMFPNGQIYQQQDAERFAFTADPDVSVFRLPRKAAVQCAVRLTHERRTKRHRIVSVTPVASVPVKCVGINSDSHLFLAGPGMVPTHNSAFIEHGALQTKVHYVGSAEAVEGYEDDYANANKENKGVLLYNQFDDEGNKLDMPERTPPPQGAPLYLEGMQNAAEWMRMVSGQYQADMGAPSNERSGAAITARQRQGDNATYHYLDHQSIAVRFTGKIFIDLIPKIYDTERVLKYKGEDGVENEIHVDPRTEAPAGGPPLQAVRTEKMDQDSAKTIFNPNVGKYDVEADVGPSFATKRQDAFNAYSQILAQNKELTSLIGDLALQFADFPGADEAARRLKRMVPPQALDEDANPQVKALTGQLQQAHTMLEALAKKLEDKEGELSVKHDKNAVEAYRAQSDRLSAIKEALSLDPQGLMVLVREVLEEAAATSAGGNALLHIAEETPGLGDLHPSVGGQLQGPPPHAPPLDPNNLVNAEPPAE